MRQPAPVIVCGSNYARSYVRAIAAAPDRWAVAGILARGSARSRALAQACGVPIFLDPDDIPEGCDLACAAMSGAASETLVRLPARGLHVICEHPQKAPVISRAIAAATKAGRVFHLNGHFGDLHAPAEFITRSTRRGRAGAVFVHVAATDRSLWGAIDIAGRALGRVAPFSCRRAGGTGPFHLIEGELGSVPTSWRIQTSRGPGETLPDGHPGYLVDIRVEIGFPDGILSLLSVAGPVIWNAGLGRAPAGNPIARLVSLPAESLAALEADRVRANLAAIDALAHHVNTGRAPGHQDPGYLTSLAEAWDAMAATLAGG